MRIFAVAYVLIAACGLPEGLDTDRNNPLDPGADSTLSRCGNSKRNSAEPFVDAINAEELEIVAPPAKQVIAP